MKFRIQLLKYHKRWHTKEGSADHPKLKAEFSTSETELVHDFVGKANGFAFMI
jgi:hypothetical protein